jgi:hypothetical protein
MHRRQHLLVGLMLIGCGSTEHSGLARPVIDTLPGGVVRVRNPGPTGWSDSSGFRLEEDLAITGTAGEVSELANPDGLAVDRSGRIYVSDGTIKLFAADGRFIRTVGRDGAGPGEYRGTLISTRVDQLLVQDPSLARLTVFDSSGTYVRSWRTVCCVIAPPSADAAGRVTVRIQPDRGERYARFAPDGSPLDTMELPEATPAMWRLKTGYGGWSHSIPFTPTRVVALPPSGGILHGWTADYTIIQSRDGRDTTRLISRSWTPLPLSDARREAEVKYYVDFITRHRQNLGGVEQSEIDRVFRVGDLPATSGPSGSSLMRATIPCTATSTSSLPTASTSARCAPPRSFGGMEKPPGPARRSIRFRRAPRVRRW